MVSERPAGVPCLRQAVCQECGWHTYPTEFLKQQQMWADMHRQTHSAVVIDRWDMGSLVLIRELLDDSPAPAIDQEGEGT